MPLGKHNQYFWLCCCPKREEKEVFRGVITKIAVTFNCYKVWQFCHSPQDLETSRWILDKGWWLVPVWMYVCFFMSDFWWNLLPQYWQGYGLVSEWMRRCVDRVELLLKVLPHCLQENIRSLLWTALKVKVENEICVPKRPWPLPTRTNWWLPLCTSYMIVWSLSDWIFIVIAITRWI